MSDARSARNETSVRQLHAYLLMVRLEPRRHIENESLHAALKSQGSLARFAVHEAGITPMSLNTAKRAADAVFGVGGFDQLDRLRLDCSEALEQVRSASPQDAGRETKNGLKARALAAEAQVGLLSEDLQLATGLLRDCLRQGKTYARRADPATQALCDKEQRIVLQMLGLLRTTSK